MPPSGRIRDFSALLSWARGREKAVPAHLEPGRSKSRRNKQSKRTCKGTGVGKSWPPSCFSTTKAPSMLPWEQRRRRGPNTMPRAPRAPASAVAASGGRDGGYVRQGFGLCCVRTERGGGVALLLMQKEKKRAKPASSALGNVFLGCVLASLVRRCSEKKRSEMPRRGIHPLVRTATLVLRNGASISIETVAPATKPVMLSVVSLELSFQFRSKSGGRFSSRPPLPPLLTPQRSPLPPSSRRTRPCTLAGRETPLPSPPRTAGSPSSRASLRAASSLPEEAEVEVRRRRSRRTNEKGEGLFLSCPFLPSCLSLALACSLLRRREQKIVETRDL